VWELLLGSASKKVTLRSVSVKTASWPDQYELNVLKPWPFGDLKNRNASRHSAFYIIFEMFAIVTALCLGEAGRAPQRGYARLLGRNNSQIFRGCDSVHLQIFK
jgi:hypothetical protein